MENMKRILLIFLLFMGTILASCKDQGKANDQSAPADESAISKDTAKLREWIQVPFPLSGASWEIKKVEDEQSGPSETVFVGKLDFAGDSVPADLLNSDALDHQGGLADTLLNNWKGQEIMKYFEENDLFPGMLVVRNRKCYDPKLFLTGSFAGGFYFVLENNSSIFLYLVSN